MSDNLSELLGRKGVEENFFNKLGELARPDGAPSEAAMEELAKEFLVGKANAFGTASFYDFLKPENKGKQVYVCNGTACVCAGTQNEVIEKLQDNFASDQIGHMTCLGRCHENSAFHYKGKNYSGSAIEQLGDIVKEENHLNQDTYNVAANGPAILTQPFSNIDDYYAPFLKALTQDSAEVLEEIKNL